MSELDDVLAKVRDCAVDDISNLLDEVWPQIVADLGRAVEEASRNDKRARFAVNLRIMMEPKGETCGVSVKAAWGCRKAVETEVEEVSLQPMLFDGKAGAA